VFGRGKTWEHHLLFGLECSNKFMTYLVELPNVKGENAHGGFKISNKPQFQIS